MRRENACPQGHELGRCQCVGRTCLRWACVVALLSSLGACQRFAIPRYPNATPKQAISAYLRAHLAEARGERELALQYYDIALSYAESPILRAAYRAALAKEKGQVQAFELDARLFHFAEGEYP